MHDAAMNGVSPYRARILPITDDAPRPQWSVMIPSYNCGDYLRDALLGVLAQDPGPDLMQIEVVDDYSTRDDPEAIVREIGRGRVSFHRQPENVGHIRNFDTCIQRARGRIVHLLHGDDAIRPGFYERMVEAFGPGSEAGAAFCRQAFIDDQGLERDVSPLEQESSGILENWLERLATEQRIMTPSMVVRRDVYEAVGGFDRRLVCAEDWEMWIRIASRYPVWYEPEALARYRMHVDSNTGRHVRTGEDISYTRMAIDIFSEYLPSAMRRRAVRSAKRTYARSAIAMAYRMGAARDYTAVRAQVGAALDCSRSPEILARVSLLLLRLAAGRV